MSNADGRENGFEKAQRHRELCQFYIAAIRGLEEADEVLSIDEDYIAVHGATQILTDNLDESIGFPLEGIPDYDKFATLFFEEFHRIAMGTLHY